MTEQNPHLEPLLTPKQLAQYLGFQPNTVRIWIRKGVKIDPAKVVKIGTGVRIHRSEAERLAGEIKANLGKPTEQ